VGGIDSGIAICGLICFSCRGRPFTFPFERIKDGVLVVDIHVLTLVICCQHTPIKVAEQHFRQCVHVRDFQAGPDRRQNDRWGWTICRLILVVATSDRCDCASMLLDKNHCSPTVQEDIPRQSRFDSVAQTRDRCYMHARYQEAAKGIDRRGRVTSSDRNLFHAVVGRSIATILVCRKEASQATPDVLSEYPGLCGTYIIMSAVHFHHRRRLIVPFFPNHQQGLRNICNQIVSSQSIFISPLTLWKAYNII
jgi:hypothetical protein